MIITYSDGRAVEAALLKRTNESMRVAIEGSDDVTEFRNINGRWVSEDCEPASIEFEWQRKGRKPAVSEADCCWSCEQAARLLGSLIGGVLECEDVSPRAVN
jgi:hypothetical protein